MKYKLIFILSINLLQISLIFSAVLDYNIDHGEEIWDHEMYWDNDVYTGRHFDEAVSTFQEGERRVSRHTILIMYDDNSYRDIEELQLNNRNLPGHHFLNIVKYNARTTPRHIWYRLLGVDNLVERYIKEDAHPQFPVIFFFKSGNRLDQYKEFPKDVFDLDDNPDFFKLWVWDQLKVDLLITNKVEDPLIIKLYDGPKQSDSVLQPDDNAVVHAHVSTKISIISQTTGQILWGLLVQQGMDDTTLVIDEERANQYMGRNEHQWLEEVNSGIHNFNNLRYGINRFLGLGYLRMFKQPMLVEKYTDSGFMVSPIPRDLHERFVHFYENNQDTREAGCMLADGSSNGGEVDCTYIPLPDQTKIELAEIIRPLLENWCDRELEMTHLYGITEYWNSSVIIQNLGEVIDHVISAELILRKELQGESDWELETLNNRGEISYTYVQEGEMIFYESSSVSIKRPRPLKGRSYITAVVHFRPKIGWPWRYADENYVLSDGHTKEKLRVLNTRGTLRSEFRRPARSPQTAHTEL